MANPFVGSGILDIDSYKVSNLDKTIDLLWERKDAVRGKLAQFFHKMSGNAGSEMTLDSISDIVGLPVVSDDTAKTHYVQSAPGFKQAYQYILYKSGIQATRQLIESDRHGKIVKMAGGLMKSAMKKDEYLFAGILNNAFGTTLTADAVALCSNSHLHENAEAGTYDNLSTGALTGANIQAARLVMRQFTDEIGAPYEVEAKTLLVTENDEQAARELVNSKYRAEDSLNAETQLIGDLNIVVSTYLTDSDAYFLFGDATGEAKGLVEIVLSDWSIANNAPSNCDILIDKRIRCRKAVGAHYPKNIVGSAGA